MGVLGVICGALIVLPILSPLPIVQTFWLGAMAVLLAKRWPNGVPAAWTTGEAVPWPSQAEAREKRRAEMQRRRGGDPEPAAGPSARGSGAPAPAASKKKKRKRRAIAGYATLEVSSSRGGAERGSIERSARLDRTSTGRRSSDRPSSRSSCGSARRSSCPARSSSWPGTWASSCSWRTPRTSCPRRVYEGLTVGYCLALTQFVMVLVLGLLYLRKSDREFDPLAAKAIEKYERRTRGAAHAGADVGARAAHRDRGGRAMTRLRSGQHHGGRRLRDRPRDHAGHHLLGVQARVRAPSASTPPGAASAASRTASRSPATTCRPRRSSASPA